MTVLVAKVHRCSVMPSVMVPTYRSPVITGHGRLLFSVSGHGG